MAGLERSTADRPEACEAPLWRRGRLVSQQAQGLIAVNAAAALFGTAALFGKLAVSPVWIVGIRAVFAVFALLAVDRIRERLFPMAPRAVQAAEEGAASSRKFSRSARHLLPSIVLTGALLATHWLTFFVSVQWAGVAVATLTFSVFPLFTLIFESLRRLRGPHPVEIGAGVAIVLAVGLLVDFRQIDSSQWLGTLAGLSSALAFSIFGIASKRLSAELSSVKASLYQNLVVAGLLLPLLPFVSGSPGSAADWGWLVVLGVVSTALMHQLFFFSLQRLPASTCSGFIALEPVYAIVYASLLFGETITVWVGVSAALIVGASLVILRLEKARSTSLRTTGVS